MGVEVTREGRPGSACFLAAYTPGRRRFGDIELDGKLAAGRWRDPQAAPEYAALINGVLLRRGPRSLEASAPATLYVEQLAPDQLLMKIGSESAGTLTLVGSVPGTVTVERDGQRVEATAARERSLTFQAAADASYRVSGVTDWQSIRLACEAPAREDAVQPAAAKPLETAVRAEPGIQSPLPGKNQIANAGFEVNLHTRGDLASPWEQRNSYYFAWFGTGHDYDGEVAHTGRHSARISRAQSGQVTLRGGIEQKFSAAAAGKTYTLSAWLKAGVDPTRVRLVLYGWNPKWGRDFEGGVSPEFTIGTEWQRITWTRTFGPEVTDAYAMTVRPYQVMGGDIWIDDVQVEEGAEATDFAPDAWSARAQKETPGQPLSR
ncbi:MAG: hypothetical protein HY321_03980 [Armatimonadetes bacterium]|nr:hypothetical protein [Armatimonadota bacterium]